MGGSNIKKDQLIGAGRVITASQLHRITSITQTDEIDPLNHPSGSHVKAGNDPFGYHGTKGRD